MINVKLGVFDSKWLIRSGDYGFGISREKVQLSSLPRCLAMAQSRRRRRRSFTFQFRRDGENARARTCVYTHTCTRRSRAESALRERRSDRAIAPCTVTRAYTFGARSPPSLPPRSPPPPRVLIAIYRDRVTAESNPRFRIPSSTLSGEALLLLPSARPIFYELPVSGPI